MRNTVNTVGDSPRRGKSSHSGDKIAPHSANELRRYPGYFRTAGQVRTILLEPGLLGMPPNGSKIRRGETPQVGVACENPSLDQKRPTSPSERVPSTSRSATIRRGP